MLLLMIFSYPVMSLNIFTDLIIIIIIINYA